MADETFTWDRPINWNRDALLTYAASNGADNYTTLQDTAVLSVAVDHHKHYGTWPTRRQLDTLATF